MGTVWAPTGPHQKLLYPQLVLESQGISPKQFSVIQSLEVVVGVVWECFSEQGGFSCLTWSRYRDNWKLFQHFL